MSEILYNVQARVKGKVVYEIRSVTAAIAREAEKQWKEHGVYVITNEQRVNVKPDVIEIYKTVTIWKRKG